LSNPIIDGQGTQRWFNLDKKLHREDGPAVLYVDGDQVWYINGKLHREDGPACVGNNGYREWWINSILYTTNKSYQKAANLSNEDMLMINLKYGDVE
jgi:hypothetical protein